MLEQRPRQIPVHGTVVLSAAGGGLVLVALVVAAVVDRRRRQDLVHELVHGGAADAAADRGHQFRAISVVRRPRRALPTGSSRSRWTSAERRGDWIRTPRLRTRSRPRSRWAATVRWQVRTPRRRRSGSRRWPPASPSLQAGLKTRSHVRLGTADERAHDAQVAIEDGEIRGRSLSDEAVPRQTQ